MSFGQSALQKKKKQPSQKKINMKDRAEKEPINDVGLARV